MLSSIQDKSSNKRDSQLSGAQASNGILSQVVSGSFLKTVLGTVLHSFTGLLEHTWVGHICNFYSETTPLETGDCLTSRWKVCCIGFSWCFNKACVCDQESTLPSLCHIQTWHTHRTSCTPGISEFHKGLNLGLHLVTLFNILNDGGVLVLRHARCLVLGLAHLGKHSFTYISNSLFGSSESEQMWRWRINRLCTFYGPRYHESFW